MRKSWRAVLWAGLTFLVTLGIVLIYRWAEPHPSNGFSAFLGSTPAPYTMRLENTSITNYVDGRKAWAVSAKRLDLQRAPNGPMSSIQTATLSGIHEGFLYPAPTVKDMKKAAPPSDDEDANQEKPAATFQADEGRFTSGAQEDQTSELALTYYVQWQLVLSHHVLFTTKGGDRFQSESLSVMQIVNRTTLKVEQRILCNAGATVTHKGITVQANQIRYNPDDQQVECLSGVRVHSKLDSLQAERLFWSFKDQTLRCPESATGTVRGVPFTATDVSIDTRQHKVYANHAQMELRMEDSGLSSTP